MAGVRGFNDPNIKINQPLSPLADDGSTMSHWYLNYDNPSSSLLSECIDNVNPSWQDNRNAYNHGLNDMWAIAQSPHSIGYFKEQDIPTQFALAKNFVVADMYQSSIFSSTSPNRVVWASGSASVPGSPQNPDQGGFPYIDNWETVGCKADGSSCFPLKWKTAIEHYEDAGVDWMVYQDPNDNFDDNPWWWFQQFRDTSSSLYKKGSIGQSYETFLDKLKTGTLPELSILVPGASHSEHSGMGLPSAGAHLQDEVARAVLDSPAYARTALIISYDEGGGWYDHVPPYHSPRGTPGEWLEDPLDNTGYTFAGPGIRVPLYIISPWTRNGGVYTEHSDHTSQLQFIEKWQAAKGRNVVTDQMIHWRRENMADLTSAFNFQNPDYSKPDLPQAPPFRDFNVVCTERHGPTPPGYKGYNQKTAKRSAPSYHMEKGWKAVRGKLTEGRHLTMVMNEHALTRAHPDKRDGGVHATRAVENHDALEQHWVITAEAIGGDEFTVASSADGRHICHAGEMCGDKGNATVYTVGFEAGKGHTLWSKSKGQYMHIDENGEIGYSSDASHWNVFSVSY